MNTFSKVFGVISPEHAQKVIESDIIKVSNPSNLEEKAISMVGRTVYNMLIKGYTEKQWGKSCKSLPADVISRIPLRFTYDNNYFSDDYQGIPKDGYTSMIKNLLDNADVMLETTFKKEYEKFADIVIYTGKIDEYYDYLLGALPYRSLKFEEKVLNDISNFQGNAVVNYTEREIPYTRIIEHKFFNKATHGLKHTIITKEYPVFHDTSNEPYYPINTKRNLALYEKYRALSKANSKIIFAGRTGEYKYFDMDDTVANAIHLANKLIKE